MLDFFPSPKLFELAVALGCVLFFAFVGVMVFVLWPAWNRTLKRLGSNDIYGGE